jgi:hypothetical protein
MQLLVGSAALGMLGGMGKRCVFPRAQRLVNTYTLSTRLHAWPDLQRPSSSLSVLPVTAQLTECSVSAW